MGCIKHFSCGSNNNDNLNDLILTNTSPNPNPYRFKILRSKLIGKYLITKVNYPDCNTFEGNKIMIYENINIEELYKLKVLDPHFIDNNHSPIARFKGNKEGWNLAEKFCIACLMFDTKEEKNK